MKNSTRLTNFLLGIIIVLLILGPLGGWRWISSVVSGMIERREEHQRQVESGQRLLREFQEEREKEKKEEQKKKEQTDPEDPE